jgi:hypothetical protein
LRRDSDKCGLGRSRRSDNMVSTENLHSSERLTYVFPVACTVSTDRWGPERSRIKCQCCDVGWSQHWRLRSMFAPGWTESTPQCTSYRWMRLGRTAISCAMGDIGVTRLYRHSNATCHQVDIYSGILCKYGASDDIVSYHRKIG